MAVAGQRFRALSHMNRGGGEVNARIGPVEMRLPRHKAVLERQDGFGQPHGSGGGIQMPEISLDGTDGHGPARRIVGKGAAQAVDFHRVAQCCARAVGFNEVQIAGNDAGRGGGGLNDGGLGDGVGGGDARRAPVLIDG